MSLLRRVLRASREMIGRLAPSSEERALRARRDATDALLAKVSADGGERFEGAVLVDGMWDNPNHWLRYALLRAALGLATADEIGLIGPYHGARVRRTLRRLGVRRFVEFDGRSADLEPAHREARRLIASASTPDDVLGWSLPEGLPAFDLYDGILKRQRHAVLDLKHPRLEQDVAEYLVAVQTATRILDATQPRLLITSHTASARVFFGPLVWLASRRGIPIVVPYGAYGVLRYYKVLEPEDVFDYASRPTLDEIESLPAEQAEVLAQVGRDYIDARLGGRTDDLAAVYAFHKGGSELTREDIASAMGWPSDRPIIAVYASTWFDNPHAMGMTHFRDFVDWLQSTLAVAREHREVSWLFKRHPCDEWYGGVTLKDLLPAFTETHVRQCPDEWHGGAITRSIDGLISLQGTAGVEYACVGKPVLVADRGWYHDRGFVVCPRSREEYLAKLVRPWWTEIDTRLARRRAQIFAGWYFGRPVWNGRFLMPEDSDQDKLYEVIPALLRDNPDVVRREIAEIRAWYRSDHRLYHTFKMRRAEAYALPAL